MEHLDPGETQGFLHVPVMVEEVRRFLVSESTHLVMDCTVGCGGHAASILGSAPGDCVLYGLDLDDQALLHAGKRLAGFGKRVNLKRMNFKDLEMALPQNLVGKVDALLIDCGISMLQIVTPDRGFSFDREGDLDMRFDSAGPSTAATLLSGMDVEELRNLLLRFGQRAGAKRIAQAIVRRRDAGELRTTLDLAAAIKSVVKTGVARALARCFLAIRASVNRELENLAEALDAVPRVLAKGGRACVISYHSDEDRVTKQQMRRYSGKCVCPPGRIVCDCGKAAMLKILTPKPLMPSAEEIRRNPSARSARTRVIEKM
jgi:16S rRNA (cytosine1402-N4)-methyltransferase